MTTRVQSGGRAQSAVRRVILFVILFALVAVGATGISGLLERVLGATSVIVSNDAALALSLAYALIAGPLAGVLWWWERRRLIADPSERASLAWALYVTAMSLTSLIVSTTALVGAAAAGIDGEWRPAELSTGIVWLAVWFWHRHMRRSAATAPTRLVDVPTGLGAIYGLAVAASGAITLIAVVLAQAILSGAIVIVGSQYWLTIALQSLLWCAMGTLVWWWHWFREQAKDAPSGFASVLVIVVVAAAAATTLFAIGGVLLIALRLLFGTDPAADIVSELDVALAAALVGAIVWVYHAHVLASRSGRSRRAARLVVSAIALVGAASGFGVVVNSLLATFSGALVGDARTLLLGGVSSLVVGGTAWAIAWRPTRAVEPAEATDPARRVYLVVIFGASAVVAIVTLLIIGFRIFEFVLEVGGSDGFIERVRAPLGLLSSTAVVFAYHFTIWRRDRSIVPPAARRQVIGKVVVVSAGDVTALTAAIRADTGAAVSLWPVAVGTPGVVDADAPAVLELLAASDARRVLVIAGESGGVRVIPLAE